MKAGAPIAVHCTPEDYRTLLDAVDLAALAAGLNGSNHLISADARGIEDDRSARFRSVYDRLRRSALDDLGTLIDQRIASIEARPGMFGGDEIAPRLIEQLREARGWWEASKVDRADPERGTPKT